MSGELQRLDDAHRQKVAELQGEIEKTTALLRQKEQEAEALRQKLQDYQERESMISQVLITAQQNARKIESEARENAGMLLEKCDSELKEKKQELEKLKVKVGRFKEEFREIEIEGLKLCKLTL